MTAKVNRTLQVLTEIRDEQRRTRERLETLETTVATEMNATAMVLRDIHGLLRDRLDQRDRVDDHERRIQRLERRSEG